MKDYLEEGGSAVDFRSLPIHLPVATVFHWLDFHYVALSGFCCPQSLDKRLIALDRYAVEVLVVVLWCASLGLLESSFVLQLQFRVLDGLVHKKVYTTIY